MATMTDDDNDAQWEVHNLADALAQAIELADYFADEPPPGKGWKALVKDLRALRGPMHAALVRLQELDPDTVRDALAEMKSPLLCVCGR
jgi:hypothetical protein